MSNPTQEIHFRDDREFHTCCSHSLYTFFDTLTVRVIPCENRQGKFSKITTLKAIYEDLRKDVDYLKSTDLNLFIGRAYNLDTLETSGIPMVTTVEVQMDDIADE